MTDVAVRPPRTRRLIAGYAVLLVLTAVATVFGAWLPLLIAVSATPWFVVVQRRWGRILTAVLVPATAMAVILGAFIVAPVIGIPLLAALVGVFFLGGAGGAALWWREPERAVRSPRRSVGSWVLQAFAVSAGAVVWGVTLLLARVIPGASVFAWALLNDAANSLAFTRQVFIDGGVRLGPAENPVPLVASLVASGALPGRWLVPAAGIAEHDVRAFAGTWGLLIGLLCVLAGLLTLRMLRSRSRVVRLVAPALASFLPLTWFISGLPMEQGYLNVPLGLTVMTMAAVAYAGARETPVAALVLLALCGTLMLATWSPLGLMVALLGAVVVVRGWRSIVALRGWRVAVVVAAVAQALLFAVFATLPTFGASQEAVLAPIPVYPIRVRALVIAAAIAVLVGIGLWITRRRPDALLGMLAVIVGGGGAIGLFLFLRRDEELMWGYYPYKALWFVLAALVIILFCATIALIADVLKAWPLTLAGLGVLAVGTHLLLGAVNSVPEYGSMNPINRVLTGTVFVDNAGDGLMERVFAFSDPDAPGILWRSGDPNERRIDFWVVKLASPGFDSDEMHQLAYTLDFQDVAQLCRISEVLGDGGLTIHTADPELEGQVASECADLGNTVVLTP